LKSSELKATDEVFVLSVAGANPEKNVSSHLLRALRYAADIGTKIFGIVGRDDGYTGNGCDAVSIVPTVNPDAFIPHPQAFRAAIWYLLGTYLLLESRLTKWERTL
jgi:D-sedoheptulose 7-phosphate isomerase